MIMRTHTSSQFEAEVRDLRALVIAMGERCSQVLELSLDAFLDGDARRRRW